MVKVQHTMHTTFLRLFFLTVVISITNAVEDRLKRQEFLLPPLEMRLQENIPGNPVLDYPIFDEVPDTSFHCSSHQHAGYYADMEARCQVFHICQFSGRQDSFLCPNGTVFDQRYFVCNWWFNVDCNLSPTFYSLNSQLFTSSDSPLVTQEFISQDVDFNPPESLPVPGVVGGGSVIPSPNNNFRDPHSLDNLDAPSKDWQLASTSGSVSSWSRPSNQNSNHRPINPAVRENYPVEFEPVSAPAPAPFNYPGEEQDFDYPHTQLSPQLGTVPITTYRPRVPYVPPKIHLVNIANVQSSTETYQGSEDFPPEETLPRQPPTYYTPRVPERQRPGALQPPVTQNYPGEDEFISEETFPEDTSSYTHNVISDTQRPVPLSPEEELSLSSDYPPESVSFDYDTYTTSPEPSPLEAEFNYGQRLNPSTTVTPAPVQITSPRVKIHKQKRPQVSTYPVEEDLPLEEMLPITESVRYSQPEVSQTPRHYSTPSYYPSERPTQPQPDPVPDPQIAPEIDYRSPQTLQFVSGEIPITFQNKQKIQNGNVQYESTVLPEVQQQQQQQQQQTSQFFSSQSPMQTFNQDLEFGPLPQTTHRVPQFISSTSPPIDQQIDFRSLQNTQRVPQFDSGTSPAPMLDQQTQTLQFISTPISIVPDFSTEFSNVSIDSMPHNAISVGQSYLPEILDLQSEIPIGGSSADIQQQPEDNNLYEYRFPEQAIPKPIPEQPPIKTVQTYPTEEPFESNVNNIQNQPNFVQTSSYAPTSSPQIFQPRVVQPTQRPSYPTKYTSVNDPISAPDQIPQFNQQQTNNKKPSYPSDEEESLPTQQSTPTPTPAYSLPNALAGLKVENQNNQQNGDNNNFSNQFGPLEILTVDKRPILQSTEPITATHNPTYVSIRPSYPSSNSNSNSNLNQGQLEDLVVSTPPQNLLAPFPQRGSINNNNYNQLNQQNQQIPSRVPHFNNNNNNINNINNNNNIQNQFPHQNNNNNIQNQFPHQNNNNNNNNNFRPAQFPHQNNNNNNNNNNFNNNFRPQNQIIFPRHNNNNNNNFNNNFGRNADIQDKHNSIGALNGVNNRGSHLTQGQNQNGNFISPHKSIPNNGFLTNPRNTKPVSVPLISLPLFKSNDREWAIQKLSQQIFSDVDRVQSMANVRSLTVPAGSRPVVIRLASDPRIPPKIEINRRIDNGNRNRNRNRNGKEKKQLRKRPIKRRTNFS